MGRKKKKAIIRRVLLALASAAILAAAITAFKAWKAARTGRADMEVSSEADSAGTEETEGAQQGIIAWDNGDGMETGTEGPKDTEPGGKGTQTEGVEGTEATEDPEDTEATKGTEDAGTEKEEEAGQKYAVTILNKDEFAKQVMASRAYLLDKQLSAYVEKKRIKADEGKILDVAVASDDAHCTEFYVELNNKKKSLVTLRWDPYKCTVKASKCQYTRQEVQDAAWADGSAAVRDISREEEAALLERMGEEQTENQTEDQTDQTGPAVPEGEGGEEVILE